MGTQISNTGAYDAAAAAGATLLQLTMQGQPRSLLQAWIVKRAPGSGIEVCSGSAPDVVIATGRLDHLTSVGNWVNSPVVAHLTHVQFKRLTTRMAPLMARLAGDGVLLVPVGKHTLQLPADEVEQEVEQPAVPATPPAAPPGAAGAAAAAAAEGDDAAAGVVAAAAAPARATR